MTFLNKYQRSREAFRRACRIIPGGVNSPARAFGGVGGEPIVIERGQGAYIWDIDGNQYIDYVGSWGPLILGHAHPAVVAAIEQAARKGTSFGAPTEAETELAELICRAIPNVEMIRLVNSGTEAAMSAIRLARGYTRRERIIKFAGCYHGHVDSLLVQAGSSATTLGVPNSLGVTSGSTADTICLHYNDTAAVEQAFAQFGSTIAGVILEPIVGNMGVVLPTRDFLQAVRDETRRYGALLIYDEVMTGFRVAWGGAQEYLGKLGLQPAEGPDLVVLGKIIGGGLPVGAYGGRAEIMKFVAPVGPVFQAGTLSGNPIAVASGLATLRELERTRPYEYLEQLSRRLCEGLSEICHRLDLPHQIQRAGSMWTLFFNEQPVSDYRIAIHSHTKRFARFFWAMLERGVYLPCSQFEAAFISAAHGEREIDATLAVARQALAECLENY
ncbi:MAG: glutamate-1-semialdehyde 2,1-aminomutase [Gemmatales bacterium]|nr:glutamate-1-semialdehyde 2,1-aminomutase [Gemmatales bacterium]MDW7995763.1 glutamate-1-semialdehyde 2,1-aminomutase [Gemmatales bacterium]